MIQGCYILKDPEVATSEKCHLILMYEFTSQEKCIGRGHYYIITEDTVQMNKYKSVYTLSYGYEFMCQRSFCNCANVWEGK